MLFKPKKSSIIILSALAIQTAWMAIVITIIFHSPNTPWRMPVFDVTQYFEKVWSVLHGSVPFRLLPLEYPIGTWLLIVLPGIFAATIEKYLIFFVAEVAVWNAICYWLVIRWARMKQGDLFALQTAGWYTLWMVALTPLWGLRIDVPTATLMFLSFMWLTNRPTWSAAVGIIGGYVKLVPLIMALVAFRQRRSLRVPLIALGTFIFIALIWWIVAQPSMMYAIRYHLQRGIEIGSLYSGALLIVGKILHWQMFIDFRFFSAELTTPVPAIVLKFIPLLQVAAVLYPLFRLRAGTTSQNLRLVVAMVLGYIIFGKVLSPQYILWLVPFYAVMSGHQAHRQQIVFSLICIGTTVIYPFYFAHLAENLWEIFLLLNTRNAMLIWLYWLAIRPENDTSILPTTILNKLPNKEKPTTPNANQPNSAMVY